PRFDAELYNQVIAAVPALIPDFGDFGCASPTMPAGGWRPNPNLRYTSGMSWQVFREQAVLPGNDSFFTVCQKVVASAHWPPSGGAYSWGDAEIERCSTSTGSGGRATEWRAYGTSHHLAHVVERLATT